MILFMRFSVEPHFDLGGDGDTVCEICRRLDGIKRPSFASSARSQKVP
jgi:hypothetical protein